MRYIIIFSLVISGYICRSQHVLQGVVMNEQKEDISFCHVYNSTVDLGKVSDRHGNFSVLAHKSDTVLFSFVGYQTLALIVSPEHLLNYLQIVLTQDSVLLPSITIYADRYYKIPLNTQGGPMQLYGMERQSTEDPIKAGDARFGITGTDGIGLPGVVLYGPITYFSRDAREQRKAQEVYEETRETITYQRFIAQDWVRVKLQAKYELNSEQYDELIVRLNKQFPGIQRQYNPNEIWNWLLTHFDRSASVIKGYESSFR